MLHAKQIFDFVVVDLNSDGRLIRLSRVSCSRSRQTERTKQRLRIIRCVDSEQEVTIYSTTEVRVCYIRYVYFNLRILNLAQTIIKIIFPTDTTSTMHNNKNGVLPPTLNDSHARLAKNLTGYNVPSPALSDSLIEILSKAHEGKYDYPLSFTQGIVPVSSSKKQ